MIEVDFSDVKKMLADMLDGFDNIDGIIEKAAGPILRASFNEQFDRGGYPVRWKPLKWSTIQQKKAQGYPRRNRLGQIPKAAVQRGFFGPENILIRTTSLRQSWTQDKHPYHICKAQNGVLTIGSTLMYARYHQSDKPRKKLPRRPIVVTKDTLDGCAIEITARIVSRARR